MTATTDSSTSHHADVGSTGCTVAHPIGCATVQVWWADRRDARPGHAELLDPVERVRLEAYRRPEDADRFLLGCALVRLVAATYVGTDPARVQVGRDCPRCARPHGKVQLPGTDLEVSVTHSGDLVGVAFHRGAPVGLDVERIDRSLEVPGEVLTGDESAALRGLPPDEQIPGFLRYWTRKEALVKATGDGLSIPLTDVEVTAPDQPAALRSWRTRPDVLDEVGLFDLTGAAGHVAALAVLRGSPVTVTELGAEALLRRA